MTADVDCLMTQKTDQNPRVAVVTGASSGIGRTTALALAAEGWAVVLAARSSVTLAEVAAECAAGGGQTLVVPTDVGNGSEVDALFERAVQRFGRVDAVIHAAAAVGYGRFEDIPVDVFDRVLTTNLTGTANVARAALRVFQPARRGHLILLGSLLGKISVPLMSPYVTSKWAVHALARAIYIEAKQTPGISVSLISPGSVNTPAYYQAANYLHREGRPPPPVDQPEKVARAILRTLRSPRRERSVGLPNHLVVLGFRVFPALYDGLVTPLLKAFGLSRRDIADHSGTVFDPLPAGNAAHGRWGRLRNRRLPR